MKSFITLLFTYLVILPGPAWAQDGAEAISQFRRTVFKLQQEMLELKEEMDRQAKELRSQKEELVLQVERLNRENQQMRKHLLEMDSLMFQMEDRLESSSLVKLNQQLQNLRDFNQAILLEGMNQGEQSEKLLLEILNQPESSLPKDLLILILAQQKKRQRIYNESISYYSTLLSEFSDSAYFSQAIYEMSDVLGESGKADQQATLLAQLASLSETDPYSLKAQTKLEELGTASLFAKDAIRPDSSADVGREETIVESAGSTMDATSDSGQIAVSEPAASEPNSVSNDATSDATSDNQQVAIPEPVMPEPVSISKDITSDASIDEVVSPSQTDPLEPPLLTEVDASGDNTEKPVAETRESEVSDPKATSPTPVTVPSESKPDTTPDTGQPVSSTE